LRFFLDNDVALAVRRVLSDAGHECWAASEAGLTRADDDSIAVYAANRQAAVVSHDGAFAKRRQKNTIGLHIWLHCSHVDAAEVVRDQLPEIERELAGRADVVVEVTATQVRSRGPQWL
jgi:predicted nuclease of predicted toxin-antitoxin system